MDAKAAAALRATGWPLVDGRVVVPEHVVKGALATHGVTVPRSRVAASAAAAAFVASDLKGPLVVKAWGPGLVHKSDVGAVRLGVDGSDVKTVVGEVDAALRRVGLLPAGFIVEEQQPAGAELILGVVNRSDFGPIVLLGVGGTLTELVDQSVVRLCPLNETAATEMLDAFPAGRLLDGFRGGPPVDRSALLALIMAIAGPDGLAEALGEELAELECNPIIATAEGATAVDARLILRGLPPDRRPLPAPAQVPFDRLFSPRTIGVMGASTTKTGFGNRFLKAYVRRGWTDGLVAIHPEADEIEGVRAVRSLAEVDGGLDYLLVALPAPACAQVVRDAAGKVALAQVMSGGFREAGPEGATLEQDLLQAARESGVRVVGPNCMGIYSPSGRQTWQLRDPVEPGAVSVISQSGGLAGDIIKAGAARGIRFSKVATIGNAIDVTAGELVSYFVDDPATEVIGLYVEGVSDGRALLEAFRRAAGVKPVVVLVGALSRQGARAAASHTGSMTGDARVWDAISAATGVSVVSTLEELLGTLAFHQSYCAAEVVDDSSVLVIGPGGGASILSADACDRSGLELRPVEASVQDELRAKGYGAGTSVTNPIEVGIGPAAPPDAFDPLLGPILAARPYPDVILHFNVQSFYSHGDDGAARLLEMLEGIAARRWPARVAIVLRNLDCAPPDDVVICRDRAAALGLPTFSNFDEAMVAIRAAKRFTHQRAVQNVAAAAGTAR